MPSSTFDGQNAWSYEEAVGLPLPGPALVIDTRQFENQVDFDPMALLVYLWCEMDDIAGEMRQHKVESWGNVHTFLGFRKLNMEDADDYALHDPRFWEPGKGAEHYTGSQLALQLGNLINELRNQRIVHARPGDPNQATVRVIFLVDLADQESEALPSQTHVAGQADEKKQMSSFGLAVQCAALLKAWFAHEQGLHTDDEEAGMRETADQPGGHSPMLETVAICLNTRTRRHYHLLTDIAAVYALDMLILVQPYRQDYGYLDLQAQVNHTELILSALLLHWPEAMRPGIEDEPAPHQASSAYSTLPRPVYILGAAAIEHASRWGERWWSYGLETALLEQLLDSEQVEKQDMLLQGHVREWWTNWSKEVQWTLDRLKGHLTQLAGLRTLEQFCQPSLFQAHSYSDLQQQLGAFIAWLKPFYREPLPGSLSELLASMPLLVELSKQLEKPPETPPGIWKTYQEQLHMPERTAQVCLMALFIQARGSIPRALRHLQLLETRAEHLRADIDKCDLQIMLDEWNHWYGQASERVAALELNRPRSRRREKKLALKEGEAFFKSAQALHQKQYALIYRAVEAHYELALLEQADVTRPYSKRLKELQQLLEHTQRRARYLRDVAGLRLSLGSQKPLASPWQQGNQAILLNRQDQLNQKELLKYFEQALDEMKKDNEPFALRYLAQATLRFLGPEEYTGKANGYQPGSEYLQNGQQDLQHLQVLQMLLVGAFLAARAGARLAKMEPLLANYRQAIQQIQPEPGLLSQTIQDMEEVVRFVSLQKKIYGHDLPSALSWKVPDELPLAALLAGQPRDQALEATLRPTNLLHYLETSNNEATGIVQKLDRQSALAGFPDVVRGDETCYLYLPPGWESDAFEQAVGEQLRSTVQIIRTPDIEKMIYLRVHRVYHLTFKDCI